MFGSGQDTDRKTQSLTVRVRDGAPDRQFASGSVHTHTHSPSPVPVVIHRDISLFSVQTEIMNQQYEELKGETEQRQQMKCVIASREEVAGEEVVG